MQAEFNGPSYTQQAYEEPMCYSDSEQPLGHRQRVINKKNARDTKQPGLEKRQILLTKKSSWQRVRKQVQKLRRTANVLQNIKTNGMGDKKSQRSTSSLDEAYERASILSLRLGSIGRSSSIRRPERTVHAVNPQFAKLSHDLSRWSTMQSTGVDLIKRFKCLDVKPLSSNSKIEEESDN